MDNYRIIHYKDHYAVVLGKEIIEECDSYREGEIDIEEFIKEHDTNNDNDDAKND